MTNKPKYLIPLFFSLLFMLPIVIAAAYTHPWWDDYIYTQETRAVYLSGGGIADILIQAAKTSYQKYMEWSGAYAHQFIASLELHLFNYHLYKVSMVFIVLFFIFSVFFLSYVIGKHILRVDKTISFTVGGLILVVSSYFMPVPHEFFFWLTGAVNYTLVLSILNICTGLFIIYSNINSKIIKCLLLSMIIPGMVIIGGSNHSTALFTFVFTGTWLLFKKERKTAIIIFTISTIALALNVFAPGNSVRMNDVTQMGPIEAIYHSVVKTFELMAGWTFVVPLVIVMFLVPVFAKISINSLLNFKYPALVMFSSFLLLASTLTPCYYAQSDSGPGRVIDSLYYLYLWWLIGNTFYTTGWFAKRIHKLTSKSFNSYGKSYLIAIAVICIIVIKPANLINSNGITCIKQFFSGEIQTYNREMNNIYHTLKTSTEDDVIVNQLTTNPIVKSGSFGKNSNDIRNKTAASYHGKNSLTTIQKD